MMYCGEEVHQLEKGFVGVSWTDQGLWELTFCRSTREEAAQDLQWGSKKERICTPGAIAVAAEQIGRWRETLLQELTDYYAGQPMTFSVPVDWRGYTEFQCRVLQHCAEIPAGMVTSYGKLAQEVGSPKAARAVGGAMHDNRTPIVVPCHRVVGAKGQLVGFGGGLLLKEQLLALEKRIAPRT